MMMMELLDSVGLLLRKILVELAQDMLWVADMITAARAETNTIRSGSEKSGE
jgi:hypothetical protein